MPLWRIESAIVNVFPDISHCGESGKSSIEFRERGHDDRITFWNTRGKLRGMSESTKSHN
jgi:hypothetical protein